LLSAWPSRLETSPSLASLPGPPEVGGLSQIRKPVPHPFWRRPRASATDPASDNSAASRATSAAAAPVFSAASPSLWPAALHFWPTRITRLPGQTASLPPTRELSATAVPATASH